MNKLVAVLGLVASVVAIVVLREATMSRHVPMDPASEMDVVVRGTSDTDDVDMGEMVTALFLSCQLEVTTDPVAPPERVGPDTFRFRVRPALDETDRRQLDGCLEDARIDHLQGQVLGMELVEP